MTRGPVYHTLTPKMNEASQKWPASSHLDACAGSGRLLLHVAVAAPAGPAVAMEAVGLEPAPEGGAADAQRFGGLGQLPRVGIEGAHDGIALPICQRGRAIDTGDEHRLAQL